MKKSKYLYKNCPYEDFGFTSCRVCPNFKKCLKRKEEQTQKKSEKIEKTELNDFFFKIEIILVCVLFLSLIIGLFAGMTSLAKEPSGEGEKTHIETIERNPAKKENMNANDSRDEIVPVIIPVLTVSADPVENEPEIFEGIRVVEMSEANALGPCKDWIYNISEEDMKYIAKVVWAEARGECLEGKIAVAAVILNRYYSKRSEFDTISIYNVVTQSGAFASIKGVDEVDLAEYPDCLRAVKLACRGWDPTRETFKDGALYFYNPNGVCGYQARIRTGIKVHRIGEHLFHVDFNWDEVNKG